MSVDIIVVAGGGSGGFSTAGAGGGGGGAGGMAVIIGKSLTAGNYPIGVGLGATAPASDNSQGTDGGAFLF